jgi:hypothetical protein
MPIAPSRPQLNQMYQGLPPQTQRMFGGLAEIRGIADLMRTSPGVAGRGMRATPTAPGNYAQGLVTARKAGTPGMGLVDNANAQRYQAESGYMPNVTVGGAWGRPASTGYVGNQADVNQRELAAAHGRYAAEQARRAAHIASLPGAQGVLDPETGMRRQAYAPSPSNTVLAANKSEYDARRDADLSERKAIRRARGIAEGDSRRVDRGILTYDERLQAAQPGLGIAREQAGAMRDVAGIQAGVAGRGIDERTVLA